MAEIKEPSVDESVFPVWLRIIQMLLVPLAAVWVIGISFMILLVPAITHFWAERSVNTADAAVSYEQLLSTADAGLAYISGALDALPEGNDERVAFTSDVVAHMTDVRVVVDNSKIFVAVLSVLVFAASYLLISYGQQRRLSFSWRLGGLSALTLCIVLAGLGALNFNALFTAMHKLFFADGTWIFSADSLLICTYPIAFWISMAATWAVILLALTMLVVGVSLWSNFRSKNHAKNASVSNT